MIFFVWVVHHESPDARGIDVGMIYDSTVLKLISSGKIRYTLPGMDKPTSRDIVWGKFLSKKDTLFVKADTLFLFHDTLDQIDHVTGYHHGKIFSS